jgi:hypothetical protein
MKNRGKMQLKNYFVYKFVYISVSMANFFDITGFINYQHLSSGNKN